MLPPVSNSLPAFIRLMYCPSLDLEQAVPLTSDVVTTAEEAFGPAHQYATGDRIDITAVRHPHRPGIYQVIAPPLLRRIDHPNETGRRALLILVYVSEA